MIIAQTEPFKRKLAQRRNMVSIPRYANVPCKVSPSRGQTSPFHQPCCVSCHSRKSSRLKSSSITVRCTEVDLIFRCDRPCPLIRWKQHPPRSRLHNFTNACLRCHWLFALLNHITGCCQSCRHLKLPALFHENYCQSKPFQTMFMWFILGVRIHLHLLK